jgi:hypothetical protein
MPMPFILVGVVEALSSPLTLPTRRLLELASDWPASLPDEVPRHVFNYRTMRPLRQGEVDELVAAYQAGATVFDLAARFGIDRKTVGQHLRRRGIDTTPAGLQPDEVRAAVELYEVGWSLIRIAEKFDVAGNTVRRYLLEAGVELRLRRGWPKNDTSTSSRVSQVG